MRVGTSEEGCGALGGSSGASKASPRASEESRVSETWANRPHDFPGAEGDRSVVGGFPSVSGGQSTVRALDHGGARFMLSSLFTPEPLNAQALTRLVDPGKSKPELPKGAAPSAHPLSEYQGLS